MSGLFLNKSSNEGMLLTLDTVRFFTYAAHSIAKPHSSRGTFLPYIWLRTVSTIVLFARSDTPFSWGVYGGVTWWVILVLANQSLNSFPPYYPPPSDLKTFTCWQGKENKIRRGMYLVLGIKKNMAGKFPDIAFGAFSFYDTLNYKWRVLGSYIDRLVNRLGFSTKSDMDLQEVKKLRYLLKPFAQITILMSSESRRRTLLILRKEIF
jgi:hypothetical protein